MSNRKTAIITGAGKGIGRELALRLATLNYNVVLAARNGAELDTVAGLCRSDTCDTLSVVTNVADLLEYLVKMPPRVSIDLIHLRRFNSAPL